MKEGSKVYIETHGFVQYVGSLGMDTGYGMRMIRFRIRAPMVMAMEIIEKGGMIHMITPGDGELLDHYFLPDELFLNTDFDPGLDVAAAQSEINTAYRFCHRTYLSLRKKGVCESQARLVLPAGVYMEFVVNYLLDDAINAFFYIPDDRDLALYTSSMMEVIKELFPKTLEMFTERQPAVLASRIRTAQVEKINKAEGDQVNVADALLSEEEIQKILSV